MFKGTVYPVLARYRKFARTYAGPDNVVEIVSIIVQKIDRLGTLSYNFLQLLDPQDVPQSTLKHLKKDYKLDDEFYPAKEKVELALRDGLEDIRRYKNLLNMYQITKSMPNMKWKKCEEIKKFTDSSPRDYIELVER